MPSGTIKSSHKVTVIEWEFDEVGALLEAAEKNEKKRFRVSAPEKWQREGAFAWSGKIYDGEGKLVEDLPKAEADRYTSSSNNWGDKSALKLQHWLSADAVRPKKLVFKIRIEREGPSLLPFAEPPNLTAKLFFHSEYSDVAFCLRPSSEAPVYRLIATKLVLVERSPHLKTLLDSGFSESINKVSLDPDDLDEPDDPLDGDSNDFICFLAQPASPHPTPPSPGSRPRTRSRSSRGESPPPCKKARIGEGAVEHPVEEERPDADSGEDVSEDSSPRQFVEVRIDGRSYATFDSYLYYLHTGSVDFTPSMSDYLVACQKDSNETRPAHEWLVEKAFDSDPCVPHAMYRLADEYLDTNMRELAKSFIVRSLTVDNVAYEAFCQLSMDYEDFQKPVLDFLLKNWDEVNESAGFKRAMELLEEGNLPGGGAVLAKIFKGLAAKKD
ncbi:hypothetical protein JCM8097_001478 [Rhodosporidiobolus ruineniae]